VLGLELLTRHVALAGALSLACSTLESTELEAASCDVGEVQQRIVGGSGDDALLPLAPEELNAIVALRVTADSVASWCSGVVIADGLAITAGHCVESESGQLFTLELLFGRDTLDAVATVPIEGYEKHPELDVAAVRFRPPAALTVRPIPLLNEALDDGWIGSPAELAGYGFTERDTIGERHFVVERIAEYDDTHVVVAGNGISGACTGDSGGPLYTRANDGQLAVVGILDEGDASCVGLDYYTRADLISDWLGSAARAAQRRPGCQGMTRIGACLRGRALWCESDEIRAQACPEGDVCGWSTAVGGFRCVARESDPCLGRGSLRSCQGDNVIGCESGVPTSSDCTACAKTCSHWVGASGAGCVEAG
jgi:hypothetical protein